MKAILHVYYFFCRKTFELAGNMHVNGYVLLVLIVAGKTNSGKYNFRYLDKGLFDQQYKQEMDVMRTLIFGILV